MPTRKWKSEFLVNTTTANTQNQSAVTALADGGFLIAWHDENGAAPDSIRWQRYDAAGIKVGAEIAYGIITDWSQPAIVQLADGNLWIASQRTVAPGNNDAFGDVYTLVGSYVRTQIGADSANNEINPALASLGANGGVMVWKDAASNGGDILMRGYDSTGTQTFAPVIVNTNSAGSLASSQELPQVAASKDGAKFVVTWADFGLTGGDIRARVFNANGTAFSSEFTVNATTGSTQQAPAVAWLDDGRFAVTWSSFDSAPSADTDLFAIKYAIYTAAGVLQGTERLANSTVTSLQGESVVTALPDGGFVIAWQDASTTGGDTSGSAIRLQAFDGVGDKRGGEILVNTTTANPQIEVSLATLADGRVVVTWTDNSLSGGDTTGSAIRSQIVDPRDGIIDGTAAADKLYGNDQANDTINGFDGADMLIALAGADALYGGSGADTLDGGRGDDTLYGGLDGDGLRGGRGDDELYGEDGNDLLAGGLGADVLDGGDGVDGADYRFSTGVTVALDFSVAATGEALGDAFASVENVLGSTAGADTLRGNSAANALYGNGGIDTLNGRGGNDELYGGVGADTLTGEAGLDSFSFALVSEGGDSILDFIAVNDSIALRGTSFGGILQAGVAAAFFVNATGNTSLNGATRFIYEDDDNILWYDSDGTGVTAAVMIADLQASATFSAADIIII